VHVEAAELSWDFEKIHYQITDTNLSFLQSLIEIIFSNCGSPAKRFTAMKIPRNSEV
jgi:hypothetical protein